MTILNLTNILTNLILFSTTTISPNAIEVVHISFVSTVLSLLIVLSLVLTFHANGTTVHKVLGLLLVSIFVVFLWMLQTQFLFIYIVYIMAFISAVLMLFLSVVLMLPISALTYGGRNTAARASAGALVMQTGQPSLWDSLSGLELSTPMLCLAFSALALIVYSIGQIITWIGGVYVGARDARRWRNPAYLTPRGGATPAQVPNRGLSTLSSMGIPAPETGSSTTNPALSLLVLGHSYRSLAEVVAQTYLYIGAAGSTLALLIVRQDWFPEERVSPDYIDGSLGLGQIKELLYGEQSLLLILSTTVLLVALLGAAVMTRNKR